MKGWPFPASVFFGLDILHVKMLQKLSWRIVSLAAKRPPFFVREKGKRLLSGNNGIAFTFFVFYHGYAKYIAYACCLIKSMIVLNCITPKAGSFFRLCSYIQLMYKLLNRIAPCVFAHNHPYAYLPIPFLVAEHNYAHE